MDFIFGRSKGSKSKTHPGRLNFTTKKGDKYYHQDHHLVKKTHRPYGQFKGTRSKTHKGRKNYTTKRGDKVFHRKNHYVRKSRKPYMK